VGRGEAAAVAVVNARAIATRQERYSPSSDVRILPDTADSIFWGSETSPAPAVTSASSAVCVAVAMAAWGWGCGGVSSRLCEGGDEGPKGAKRPLWSFSVVAEKVVTMRKGGGVYVCALALSYKNRPAVIGLIGRGRLIRWSRPHSPDRPDRV
jgi:hypothetical protein